MLCPISLNLVRRYDASAEADTSQVLEKVIPFLLSHSRAVYLYKGTTGSTTRQWRELDLAQYPFLLPYKGKYQVEAFKNRHQDVLSLSFEEAYELAFQEIFEITAVDNPLWDELDRLEEEYNLIHGERSEDEYEYDESFYEEYDYIEVTDDEEEMTGDDDMSSESSNISKTFSLND